MVLRCPSYAKANFLATSLKCVFARLEGVLIDSCVQEEPDLSALQARVNADRDMLHSSVADCTSVPLLLEAKLQSLQSVERIITDLWTCAGLHSILTDWRGHLLILTWAIRLRRVCDRSCSKLPSAFTIVLRFTALTWSCNLWCMVPLHSRVCTLFWRVLITAWKIFVMLMPLPILKRIIFPYVVLLESRPPFSFLASTALRHSVTDCTFPCYAHVFVAFIDALRDFYRSTINSMLYIISVRLCHLYVLLVLLFAEIINELAQVGFCIAETVKQLGTVESCN